MTLLKKQSHRIVLILILIALIIKAFYSEKLLYRDGFGWDGYVYADHTRNFKFYLDNHYINPYYFQRIGIPFILHELFIKYRIEFSDVNILKAYSFVNIGFIAIAVLFFFLTSKALNVSRNIEIVCFSLLFFCFPVLKFSLFYPVLMDIPAFSISMILVYLYVKRQMLLSFIFILLGCFVYPNFIILSTLFFFKLPHKDQSENPNPSEDNIQSKLKLYFKKINLFYLLFCFTLPAVYIYFFRDAVATNLRKIYPNTFDSKGLNLLLYWSSFWLALLYLIFLNHFPPGYFSFKKIVRSINIVGIILALLIFIGVQQTVVYFSSPEHSNLTVDMYMFYIIQQSLKNPFNFVIAHVFYLGISPLLCIFMFKDLKNEIMNLGLGMLLFFNITMYFSLGSESRQLINYYPFFILLIMLMLNHKWNVSLGFSIICCVICLALSHFWFNINDGLTLQSFFEKDGLAKFPAQRYFMFQGPWIGNYAYLIHLASCVVIVLLLWFCYKKGLIQRKKELSNQ